MEITTWLQLLTSIGTLIGMIFLVYRFLRDPDVKNENTISLLSQGCEIQKKAVEQKFSNIGENIGEIKEDLKFIKRNHIDHMERDISELKGDVKMALAILQEKYQVRK